MERAPKAERTRLAEDPVNRLARKHVVVEPPVAPVCGHAVGTDDRFPLDRVSRRQQMQLAQKQVLAPRMIQSMEILQLPLMALQERIEQEMEDNPVLDQVEVDADEPEAAGRRTKPPSSVADTERELVVKDDRNNEDDFERLLNMAENLPDDYEERSRPSMNRIEAEGDRRHDAMANMVARPESLRDYLHHQLSWFEMDDAVRRMAERIIYSLDTNGYLKTPLEELCRARRRSERRPASVSREANGRCGRGAARGAAARSARRRRAQPERMPAAAAHARHAGLRRAADADRTIIWKIWRTIACRDLEEDRHVDRDDPGSLARAAQAQAQARRRLRRNVRAPA